MVDSVSDNWTIFRRAVAGKYTSNQVSVAVSGRVGERVRVAGLGATSADHDSCRHGNHKYSGTDEKWPGHDPQDRDVGVDETDLSIGVIVP
ncbi:hypothetical protein [Gordonia effusa]|nr:hypothetical protein [Gordonia effusa]